MIFLEKIVAFHSYLKLPHNNSTESLHSWVKLEIYIHICISLNWKFLLWLSCILSFFSLQNPKPSILLTIHTHIGRDEGFFPPKKPLDSQDDVPLQQGFVWSGWMEHPLWKRMQKAIEILEIPSNCPYFQSSTYVKWFIIQKTREQQPCW